MSAFRAFPARASLAQSDLRFSKERPYESAAISIPVRNFQLEIFLNNADNSVPLRKVPAVLSTHCKKILGLPPESHFDLWYKSNIPEHVGLGSSAVLLSAVMWSLSHLSGSHVSKEEVVWLSTENYVELDDTGTGFLAHKQSSGSSAAVALFDATVFVSHRNRAVRTITDAGLHYVLIDPGKIMGAFLSDIETGRDSSRRNVFDFEEKFSKEKLLIMRDAFDALTAGRKKLFLEKLNTVSRMHDALIRDRYGDEYIAVLDTYARLGFDFCGMSSSGPMIVAVTDDGHKVEKFGREAGVIASGKF